MWESKTFWKSNLDKPHTASIWRRREGKGQGGQDRSQARHVQEQQQPEQRQVDGVEDKEVQETKNPP